MVTLLVLLIVATVLLIWQFVGYPYVMALCGKKEIEIACNSDFYPFVSIIVPTYNEENVIAKRIDNLTRIDYPIDKYEVLIVDSGSSDNTKKIVRTCVSNHTGQVGPNIRLLEEKERKGKASAINFGKRFANGEIILVTDANSVFTDNVLKQVVPYFNDIKTGAVSGRYIVYNRDTRIGSSTQFYWDIESLMRRGESYLDSACLFHGELNAWRKDLINADPEAISEDLDMSIRIRKMGYRIKYAYEAYVYEPTPSSAAEQIKQRKRTSIGTIQAIFKHFNYFFLPKDLYTFFIFPSHKTLVMLSPFLLSFLIITYLLLIVFGNFRVALLGILSTIIIFSFFFILLMRLLTTINIDNHKHKKSLLSFSAIFSILSYVLLNEWIVLLAWKDFILGSYSVLWEKVESTRSQEYV